MSTQQRDIIGYGTYGSICGRGPIFASLADAAADLSQHKQAIAGLPGGNNYSDRRLVRVDSEGYSQVEVYDDEWVYLPEHSDHGARYTMAEVRAFLAANATA